MASQDLPYVLAGQGGTAALKWAVGAADALLQHVAAGGAEVQLVPRSGAGDHVPEPPPVQVRRARCHERYQFLIRWQAAP